MGEQYTGNITYAHQATFYASADPALPYDEVWIVFHGYGQLARFSLTECKIIIIFLRHLTTISKNNNLHSFK
jgi:hypothetical protein